MKLICTGDSLVNGFPFSRRDSFPSIIARKTGIKVINIGMNGITADDTAAYLRNALKDQSVTPEDPEKDDDLDAVLISCGSNDFMMGISGCEDVLGQIKVMAAEAKAAGMSVYICAPPLTDPSKASIMWMPGVDYERVNDDLKQYRELLKEFADAAGDNVHFIDIQSAYTGLAKYSDGVHPTKEGYELIADTAIAAIGL